MAEPRIFQLAYTSSFKGSRVTSPHGALCDILSASRRNNDRSGITGYLIFDGTTFVQILEGDQLAVLATYVRIEKDPRHCNVTMIGSQEAAERSFSAWGMDGYLYSTDQDDIVRDHVFTGKMDWSAISIAGVVELARALQKVDRAYLPS
ncbi:BLUF domain-containing protein [Bosea sp. (in: a-proteobacteria)]|uniref:BLUF domain-containing protein n=1 Tax=Bosea sp. (in: a-proteobacteria) TaxID=1871050 RepID=UPI002735D309|nr:BLUF domain-containing protein [Bosea sp. (in: a-proteobacteria)]MDP3254397.1 BLUF domain-containing protein [Bosea sp. (in: a-proteobacteria)]